MLKEQTVEDEDGYRLRTKEDGGINSNILQNPADPEVTFRSKAGRANRGYVANIVERSGEYGSIIERYQYETNNYSDSEFLKDELELLGEQKELGTIVAEGANSGDANYKLAEKNNINLINTNLIRREIEDIAAEFEFSKDGTNFSNALQGTRRKAAVTIRKPVNAT